MNYEHASEHEYLWWLASEEYHHQIDQIFQDLHPKLHEALAAEDWSRVNEIESDRSDRIRAHYEKLMSQKEIINRLKIESDIIKAKVNGK